MADGSRPTGPAPYPTLDQAVTRDEAERLLQNPKLIQEIIDDVARLGVAGEKELTATVYLVGVSRFLPRPLNSIVQGPSSSGKSYLIAKTASLFPPEAIIEATQMTPQALFHMKPGSLVHKFIVAGERSRAEDDERAEATRALREMMSAGRLSKLIPMKGASGQIETVGAATMTFGNLVGVQSVGQQRCQNASRRDSTEQIHVGETSALEKAVDGTEYTHFVQQALDPTACETE